MQMQAKPFGAQRPSAAGRASRARSVRVTASASGYFHSCHNGAHLSKARKAELEAVAEHIAQPGKGITACDEGPGTIGDRFAKYGIENSEENRRAYRQMLFEAPGANQYLCAAILDPETLWQRSTSEGAPLFPERLKQLGIMPGVKPHLKVYNLPGQRGSTHMQGLDSLAARLQEYKDAGAVFAKWRSPMAIDEANGQPSDFVIEANMLDLARYALICQDVGLVPIVEPDVSMAGTHTLESALAINTKIQSVLYRALLEHGVFMEGVILKSNIVNPGRQCPVPYSVDEIAQANVDLFKRVMPIAVRSANFLSGGQSLADAAARLSVMNQKKGNLPVNLSFSWSAALQMPLFALCQGGLRLPEMEALYLQELAVASAAAKGEYKPKAGEGDHKPPKQ
ncbi:hypothetical protein OEZ85_013406 [Tetradesmus obliquus]|uniref:fructose-bisphosphate aldolase n=1 Tax=Tetradesmus obliquus TaxID=3088 RepID=A0ABY8U5L7_TETOB|nr:hypothetical protein OEZ85_013406 [Tetradesmus obliquus]